MNYPLKLRFKTITLTNQIRLLDNSDQEIAYIHQKLFKFKEEILVYSDQTKSQQIYTIRADRVIDWSPTFTLYDMSHSPIASFKREGTKSLFKASYNLFIGEQQVATCKEQNPWTKFFDGIFSGLPFIGILSGYIFHPKYDVTSPGGEQLALITKQPAFLEGFYTIDAEAITKLDERQQSAVIMLLMAITMLERDRG